jgi:hypothetical protein
MEKSLIGNDTYLPKEDETLENAAQHAAAADWPRRRQKPVKLQTGIIK